MTLPAVEAYSRQGTHMMYVVLVRIYFEVVLSTTYNAASTRSYGCSFFSYLNSLAPIWLSSAGVPAFSFTAGHTVPISELYAQPRDTASF